MGKGSNVMDRGGGRFREIFEFCPDGLFLVDANGVIQAMNRAMEVMTGWNREEVIGQRQCLLLFECRHKEGGAVCESTCPGRTALTHPAATLQAHLQIRTKQGSTIAVSTHYGSLPIDSAGASSGYVIGVMREIAQTREMKEAGVMEAILDEQTGLYHFRYLEHQLQREIKRAERHRRPLSLMMIAIDDFQHLHGRTRENEVIHRTAALILNHTRETDLIARYGSEAFLGLLPETEKQIAVSLAERLRKSVQASDFPPALEPPEHPLTVRIAIASYPWDAERGEGLIRLADQLLSPDRHPGKNRVHWKRL